MDIIDRSPAFTPTAYRRRAGKPRLVVIHHSDTATPEATVRALRSHRDGQGISTHFEVDQGGQAYCYLAPGPFVAYHAGKANGASIGIDVTHRSGQPFPETQVAATAALVAHLCGQFGIPQVVAPDGVVRTAEEWIALGVGVVRHRNLMATACPEDFPMDRLAGPVRG